MSRPQARTSHPGDVTFDFGANDSGLTVSRLQDDFAAFHLNNPQVYQALVRLARQAKVAGKNKVGIGMLFEVVRWEFYLVEKGSGGFKLNNNLRSRYARLIMQQEPDLADFFEVRELRS